MTRQGRTSENRIDRTMRINGEISFTGKTIVEGVINGDVKGDKIVITESGEIVGDLIMDEVICLGRITGTVNAKSLSIGEAAQVKAKLDISLLEIESGAILDCEVNNSSRQTQKTRVAQPAVPVAGMEKNIRSREEKTVAEKKEKKSSTTISQPTKPVSQTLVDITPASLSIDPIKTNEFFPAGEREKTINSIIEAVKSSKKMIMVTGDPGSGKTTICQRICKGLSLSYDVVMLEDVVGSTRDLLVRIAKVLHVHIDKDSSQIDILDRLKQYLAKKNNTQKTVVLVLDNSHEIYPATLEGVIKKLGCVYSASGERLQIVLLGDESLKGNLDPKAAGYMQEHPDCFFELRPLSQSETRNYIKFRLGEIQRCTNSEQSINFPDNSAARVFTFSQGVIGKIDRIVENAVELAGKMKKDKVLVKFVKNI